MLKPKEITLKEKQIFEKHTGRRESSILSFTALFAWSFDGKIKYDIVDDCLVLIFYSKQGILCTYPYGNGNVVGALKKSYDFMKKHNNPSFIFMNEEEAEHISEIFPDEFEIFSDEDAADYVYLTEELINLRGNKFQQKRNHLNAFLKNYNYTYERLTIKNIDEIKELFNTWQEGQTNHDVGNSQKATMRLIENMDKLDVICGGIRVDGKLVAFSMGEAITDEMAHIPLEFADNNYRGAFNIINRDFCANEWKDYKYINREEDMGVSGMRYAKRAYNPVKMIEKYRTIYKG